ncbi:hypothetical protein [Christiangramia aquimixticola]|uniref:hypothetical protein n=1 Tax=Christiangramia aquimixticola TaxID=1697558 RepID=UPI003AA8D239
MRKLLLLLILILILSFNDSDYKIIDFDSFTMTVPVKWNRYKIKGTDSFVGGLITDKNDTLIFDLGWYSEDLTKNPELLIFEKSEFDKFSIEEKEIIERTKHLVVTDRFLADYDAKEYLKHEYYTDSIDCFAAKFIKPKYAGFGASGIYIDSLNSNRENWKKTSLSFYGYNLSNETQIDFFKALKTLTFKEYCKTN